MHIKKGLIAAERDRPALPRARSDWVGRQRFMQLAPHRLVFVDETSVRTGLTRLHGRAPKWKRQIGTAPFGRWQTQTFIAGLTCEGLIAPWVIPVAMDRPAFDTLGRDATRATSRAGDGRDSRQPLRSPQPPRRHDPQGKRVVVSAAARLQPRSQPDRNGILKAQVTPAPHRRNHLRRRHHRTWKCLRSLHTRRMYQLHRTCRICRRLNAKGFKWSDRPFEPFAATRIARHEILTRTGDARYGNQPQDG